MSETPTSSKHFRTFREFYLSICRSIATATARRMHFAGSSLALAFIIASILTRNPWWLLAALVCGYGFAWIGHFVFEKNKPASFKQPIYSFIGDWVMYVSTWAGKIRL